MKAGRELDKLVAEKVMGYIAIHQRNEFPYGSRLAGLPPSGSGGATLTIPEYSTDIAAAWTVAERFYFFELKRNFIDGQKNRDHEYRASVSCFSGNEQFGSAIAATAPLAICLAALNAIEGRR